LKQDCQEQLSGNWILQEIVAQHLPKCQEQKFKHGYQRLKFIIFYAALFTPYFYFLKHSMQL